MMINGAHHARELTSISMVTYSILNLLYNLVQKDGTTEQFVQESNLYFIPVVNVDGVAFIDDFYSQTNEL